MVAAHDEGHGRRPPGASIRHDLFERSPVGIGDDILARWGGDEFAIALPDCQDPEARAVLSRVLAATPETHTCSIGYASWDGQESADALMARADRVLYRAKRSGRSRSLHHPSPTMSAVAETLTAGEGRTASRPSPHTPR